MAPSSTPWTTERIELLTKLIGDGFSFSEIAKQLGPGFSKNSCIGKARRLGLRWDAEPRRKSEPKPAKPKRIHVKRLKTAKIIPSAAIPRDPVTGEPISLRVALMDLTATHCRWPSGEGPYTFCGHAISTGSYCEFHYQKSLPPNWREEQRKAA